MFARFLAQPGLTGFESPFGTYATDDPTADPALKGVERGGGGVKGLEEPRRAARIILHPQGTRPVAQVAAARLAEPVLPSFRDVVRDKKPDLPLHVLGDPESPNTQTMNAALVRVRDAIAKLYNGEGSRQKRALAALTPSMWAFVLLHIYRSNENPQLKVGHYNVMQFVSDLAGDENLINPSLEDAQDYRRCGGYPRQGEQADEQGWPLGGVQRFSRYVSDHPEYDLLQAQYVSEDFEQYYEFRNVAFEAMTELRDFLSGSRGVSLRAQILADAAEFLAAYLLALPESEDVFGLLGDMTRHYQGWSERHQNGDYIEIGPGQAGIVLMEALPDRDLILIENEPLMAKTLAHFAQMMELSRVRVLEDNVVSVNLVESSAGVIHAHFALHYLAPQDIPGVIKKLVTALPPGGSLIIEEPASGCCQHNHPDKIEAMHEALLAQGLKVRRAQFTHEIPDPIDGGSRSVVEVKFIVNKPE